MLNKNQRKDESLDRNFSCTVQKGERMTRGREKMVVVDVVVSSYLVLLLVLQIQVRMLVYILKPSRLWNLEVRTRNVGQEELG